MKKLLLIIPLVLILSLIFAAPAFADDPPGTQVDVTVVTPGDVGLKVDINAGGDVTAIVDGVDLHQTAATAQSAAATAQGASVMAWDSWQKWANADFMSDYVYYWTRTGIGPRIEGQIAELHRIAGLLANAQVKLIQGQGLTTDELGELGSNLRTIETDINRSLASLNLTIDALKAQDDKTWNQLIYGAESHIATLDSQITEQTQKVSDLQADMELLVKELEAANLNHASLLNYTDYLQRQYLYYFWIVAGVILLLTVCVMVLLFRKRAAF